MMSSLTRAALALTMTAATAICLAQDVQVQVNGNAVTFPDTAPQKIGSVVMVPVRSVFEQMGATVDWDPTTQTVTANGNGNNVVLHIGDSIATVNGETHYLDLAPITIGDRTMVPMRFLGDALGGQVTWNGDSNLVAITTNTTPQTSAATTTDTTASIPPATSEVVLASNEVIPVTLDQQLSSTTSHVGDTFTATVDANGLNQYADLPSGTIVEGHVAAVQPMTETQPAILDLAFDRIDFPNGKSEAVNGSLTSLDSQYAMENSDGTYQAQDEATSYERMVYLGYGQDGRLVGVQVDQPLDSATLTDSMGTIDAQIPEDERTMSDISLPSGTMIGIRINQPATITVY